MSLVVKKCLPVCKTLEMWVQSLAREYPLEEAIAVNSSSVRETF